MAKRRRRRRKSPVARTSVRRTTRVKVRRRRPSGGGGLFRGGGKFLPAGALPVTLGGAIGFMAVNQLASRFPAQMQTPLMRGLGKVAVAAALWFIGKRFVPRFAQGLAFGGLLSPALDTVAAARARMQQPAVGVGYFGYGSDYDTPQLGAWDATVGMQGLPDASMMPAH